MTTKPYVRRPHDVCWHMQYAVHITVDADMVQEVAEQLGKMDFYNVLIVDQTIVVEVGPDLGSCARLGGGTVSNIIRDIIGKRMVEERKHG